MELDRGAFKLDGALVSQAEVLAAARIAGLLDGVARDVAAGLAAAALAAEEGIEVEAEDLQAAVDAWRGERDLIAAAAARRGYGEHGLALDDLVDHVERRALRARLAAREAEALERFAPDAGDVAALVPPAAAFEGLLPRLAEAAALRAVAPAPRRCGGARGRAAAHRRRARDRRRARCRHRPRGRLPPGRPGDRRRRKGPRARARPRSRGPHRSRRRDRAPALRARGSRAPPLRARGRGAARDRPPRAPARRSSAAAPSPRTGGPTRLRARLASARPGEALGPFDDLAVYQLLRRDGPALGDPDVRRRLEARLVDRALAPEVLRRVRFPRRTAAR